MKAIRFHQVGGPDVLRLEEIEMPRPRSGQVLIKVAAAGINYADLMRREGNYMTQAHLPSMLGSEVAGIVEDLGPDVDGITVGTRVAAIVGAGYAEYAVAGANALIPIPDSLDFVRAAALPIQGFTAYQLYQESARLQPGESVLVHAAAGGVGTLAVQVAKLLGAGTVIGTASSPEKLELVRRLGADVALNYTEEGWVAAAKQAAGGSGVDVVLEMVGGDIAQQSLECLAPFSGRLVVFGAASGKIAKFSGSALMDKNVAVIGYWLAPYMTQRPESIGRATQALMGWLAGGKLEIIVGQTFPLAETAAAHQAMAGRRTTGKVVLTI